MYGLTLMRMQISLPLLMADGSRFWERVDVGEYDGDVLR